MTEKKEQKCEYGADKEVARIPKFLMISSAIAGITAIVLLIVFGYLGYMGTYLTIECLYSPLFWVLISVIVGMSLLTFAGFFMMKRQCERKKTL